MTQEVTSIEEFREIIDSSTWVTVVDFFATWCWPCKMLSPVMEELSEEHKDITFLKVDVDELPDLAWEYWVTAMPTIVFIKDWEVIDTVVWAYPKEVFEEKLANEEGQLRNNSLKDQVTWVSDEE